MQRAAEIACGLPWARIAHALAAHPETQAIA